MPEILTAEEVREIQLPDGSIDIFNAKNERVFPGGDTAPATAPAQEDKFDTSRAVPISSNEEIEKYKALGYEIRKNPASKGSAIAVPPKTAAATTASPAPKPTPSLAPSSSTSGTTAPTLRVGSTGDQVKWLQEFLNTRGENLTVDGIFGARTDAAVGRFQYSNGLVSDGVVGPKTYAAISKYV